MKKRLCCLLFAFCTVAAVCEAVAAGVDNTLANDVPLLAGAADSVPAAPGMSVEADADKGPYVTISVSVPTKNKIGGAVAEISKMTLLRAGKVCRIVVLREGETNITVIDTVPENHKSYTYGVTATNVYGTSAATSKSIYVGQQKPKVPTDIMISANPADHRKGSVRWMPPLFDAGNIPIDPSTLLYTVSLRSSTGETILLQDSISETVCDFEYTGEGYGLFQIMVSASNIAGSSSVAYSSNKIFLGDSLCSNLVESFPDGKATMPVAFGYDSSGGAVSWSICNDASRVDMVAADDDNGFTGVLGHKGSVGLVVANYMDLSVFSDPFACVQVYKSVEQSDIELQVVAIVDSVAHVIKSVNLKSLPLQGWNSVAVDLSSVKATLPQVAFRIIFNDDYAYCFLDNIRIGDTPVADISVGTCSVPENVYKGISDYVSATVTNLSAMRSGNYSVKLLRDGMVAYTGEMPPLNPFEAVNVQLPVRLSVVEKDSVVSYSVSVSMEGDINAANDISHSFSSTVLPSYLPGVRNLTSASDQTNVNLLWDTPDMDRMPMAPVTETFESYTPFSGDFGQWLNIDGDGRNVGGFSINGNKLPINGPNAFFIMDNDEFPSQYLLPREGSGKRYASSLYTNDGKPVDDWLISPELNGCAQLIEMYVLAYFNFEVPWEIMYSTSGRDTVDFKLLKTDKYKSSWKKFCYYLPEGTKYFAVHAVHLGPVRGPYSPLFCFDDVSYIPAGKGEAEILGYNVYCMDELITRNPISKTSFHTLPAKDNIYKISVVYDRGESMPVEIDAYESVGCVLNEPVKVITRAGEVLISTPEAALAVIYNLQGVKVAARQLDAGTDCITLDAGYYILQINGKSFKLLVP